MDKVPEGKITSISYSYFDSNDAEDTGIKILNKSLFKNGNPDPDGLYDLKLGTTDPSKNCNTCGNKKNECPGHHGYIKLNYPVQNPLAKGEIIKWLKVVCHQCGAFMFNDTKERITTKKPEDLLGLYKQKMQNYKTTAKLKPCPNPDCKELHPIIDYNRNNPYSIEARYPPDPNKPDKDVIVKLYNTRVSEIFDRITDETVERAGKHPESHPKKLILWNIVASTVVIRPDLKKNRRWSFR